MKLLDYHRLRSEEERSWDRETLAREAGAEFIAKAGRLLPTVELTWNPDRLVRSVREPWMNDCLRLCELYREGTDAQRTWLRSRVDRKTAGKLSAFGMRAAVLGAREGSEPLARGSLVAFAIADLSGGDIRDFLIGLSLVCHCAGLSGADVPALFREGAAIAGPAIRTLYREWGERYPGVQGIGSMGWRQVETPDGVGFRS